MKKFSAIMADAGERKGGDDVLQSLLGPSPENSELANMPDNRILSAMAERIFSAGFVWKVIRDKWPGFEEAFLGFEPKALLFQPEEFWHDLTADKRIVRNAQKINAVRANAKFVEETQTATVRLAGFLPGGPPTIRQDFLHTSANTVAAWVEIPGNIFCAGSAGTVG